MTLIRHDVTYTTPMLDGTRIQRHAVIRRPRHLTYKGAERILRNDLADKGIIVTMIDRTTERQ